jgi:shikimate kinase
MPPIIVTGFMGSGKTEVAHRIARHLQRKAIDLDSVITQLDGKSPARLITEDGERFFRTRETSALKTVFETEPNAVVALGGGAWIQEENRDLARKFQATSVWLDVPFEICWQRITESAEDRPLGRSKVRTERLYQQRLPLYKLAQLHFVYVTDETPEQLSQRVVAELDARN